MKIAAITCTYNEDKFLPIWLDYYSRELGAENLYVIDDGSVSPVNNIFPNALRVPRSDTFSAFRPFNLATAMQGLLFTLGYDLVIFADVDEIIVPCRNTYAGLHDFFQQNNQQVYTTLGLEIVQHLNEESGIDWTKPLFAQRKYGRFSTTYCKSQITKQPWDWAHHLHLTQQAPSPHPQLYNCHLKLVDFEYACHKLLLSQQLRFVPEEVAQGLDAHWRYSVKDLFHTNYQSFFDKPILHQWDFSHELHHCKTIPTNDGRIDMAQPLKILPDFFKKNWSLKMQVLPPEYLVYVDVGGLGGLKYDFSLYPKVHQILFEPNPASVPTQANCQIMIEALGVAEHTGVLYITKSQGCCSLLKPNFSFLNSFSIKPAFEITNIEQVSVTRYKTLYNQGKVPLPDVLKIDVQGYEYQVLQGFEDLLHNVVAIELGAHLHPIYEKQKLLHDIVELLHKFGFMCKSLAHVDHWDGHIVEFDAIFTKTPQALGLLGPYAGMKLDAVLRQWNLPPNQTTFPPGWIF